MAGFGGAVALVGIAVILWQLYLPRTQQGPTIISLQADPTFSEKAPATNKLAVKIATSPPNEESKEETNNLPVLATQPTGVAQTSVLPTSVSLIKTDTIPTGINPESLMHEAQALFDMGYYTWPKPSAADRLDELLGLDPTHDGALALRDRMASLLIVKARQPYTEGFFGSARDQIKAVLAFHRNHGPAVDLLIKWDEARLIRNLNRARLPTG
jgi:hypothetical protein